METKTNTTETRSVLAGAYRGGTKKLLTHLAANDYSEEALCGRAPNLADSFALSETERAARPTCPACGKKWDKLNAAK